AGCRFVSPIAFEKVRTPHENFAVLRQLDLEPFDWRADIAWPWEGTTLSGNDAAGLFRLAVHLDDIDAIPVPERGDFGRQTGATADHQLQFVKPELVPHSSNAHRMHGAIQCDLRQRRLAFPPETDVAACDARREIVSSPLEAT